MIPLNYGPPATLDTRGAKAQQEYLRDTKHRFVTSFWTIVVLAVILLGVAAWALLH